MKDHDPDSTIEIFTDGSARRHAKTEGHAGGFAFVAMYREHRLERYGWANAATSNQMEL